MDFSRLLNNDKKTPDGGSQLPTINKPQRFSITSMMNDSQDTQSFVPVKKPIDDNSRKASINSLTNDTDVDIKGNATPSITRKNSSSPILGRQIKSPSIASLLIDETPINSMNMPRVSPLQPAAVHGSRDSLTPQSATPSKVKHSIDEELKQLDQLERRQAHKPKKYDTPPIWAHDWIPLVSDKEIRNGGTGISGANILPVANNDVAQARSKSHYSDKLAVSITNVIPYEDMTRKVTQWLYSHLLEIRESQPEHMANIELEMKFGQIWSLESDSRASIPVSTETILTDRVNYTFKPGLEAPMFLKVDDFFVKNQLKNKNYTLLKSDTVDSFYKVLRRGDKPYNIRISEDKETKRTVDQIEKKRIGDLFIYNPSNVLDFRLSLSVEKPLQDVPKSVSKEPPSMRRRKIRSSYYHDETKNRFDLTKAYTFTQDSEKPDLNYEFEVEIDTNWLIDSFNGLFKDDNQTYEDSIRVMIDNCRILNRLVG